MRVHGAELKYHYRLDRTEFGHELPLLVIANKSKKCWRGVRDGDDKLDWCLDPENMRDWGKMSTPSCPLEVTLLFADWWDV